MHTNIYTQGEGQRRGGGENVGTVSIVQPQTGSMFLKWKEGPTSKLASFLLNFYYY